MSELTWFSDSVFSDSGFEISDKGDKGDRSGGGLGEKHITTFFVLVPHFQWSAYLTSSLAHLTGSLFSINSSLTCVNKRGLHIL